MIKKIVLVLITILGLIVGFYYYHSQSVEDNYLIAKKSMIELQSELESSFVSEGYTLENPNVVLDPYDNSPLSALILFESDEPLEITITINGKDNHSTYSETFDEKTSHAIPVLGLYADFNNEVLLESEGITHRIFIQTDPLPDDFVLPEMVFSDKSKLDNELYFFTPSANGYTCAYDVNGDVRWYLTNNAIWQIGQLENGRMLLGTERLIEEPYYNTGLYEMDMLGKIYVEYSLPGGYHHGYFEMDNGNLLIASDNFEQGTVEDTVVEVDRNTGEIIKSYDLKTVLNQGDAKAEGWTAEDWFHNNSVWYDTATNSIILSGRHQDAVISIDYDSGELNWIIGDPTNWRENMQEFFFTPIGDEFEWQWSQHAAMITPEGYVFILDNGNNKSKIEEEYVLAEDSYTRGVLYEINTDDMTIKQVWQYGEQRGSEFYSPYVSDVDYIDENHYIVHSGGIVYVDGKVSNTPAALADADKLLSNTVELIDDEVVYEIILPTNNYRVEKMNFYEDYEFELGIAKRLGTLGKTNPSKIEQRNIYFAKSIDEEYVSRSIEIQLENDRLVLTGEFKKADEAAIILSKEGILSRYNISLTRNNNTVMCVAIFTDDEKDDVVNIENYVNKEGLSGVYKVYVELNGEVYDTHSLVDFS